MFCPSDFEYMIGKKVQITFLSVGSSVDYDEAEAIIQEALPGGLRYFETVERQKLDETATLPSQKWVYDSTDYFMILMPYERIQEVIENLDKPI